MLNADGLEILDLGIDSSISLHERLLTYEGNIFIKEYYDDIINLKNDEILTKLKFLQ